MSKVIFQIEGGSPVAIECNPGDNLLEAARRANVAIDAPCSGNGSCGKCRVKMMEGTLDSLQSRHISQAEWDEGWRLSCCSKVSGDCTVLVPDIASAYQSRMKTADLSSSKEITIFERTEARLRASGIHFTNPFRSVVISMAEPSLEDTMPDIETMSGKGTSHAQLGCRTDGLLRLGGRPRVGTVFGSGSFEFSTSIVRFFHD